METSLNTRPSSLLIWISTFLPDDSTILQYQDISDGKFLCDVMQRVHPVADYNQVGDSSDEERWRVLLQKITEFLQIMKTDVTQAYLPNIEMITGSQETCAQICEGERWYEVEKALRLILVCAVRCERNEQFVQGIRRLKEPVQHDIMTHIQRIIDPKESSNDKVYQSLSASLRLPSRDPLSSSLLSTPESSMYSCDTDYTADVYPSLSSSRKDFLEDLIACKTRVRELEQNLDVKGYHIMDLEQDLDELRRKETELKKENLNLQREARTARSLRDEVDTLREKLEQLGAQSPNSEMKKKQTINDLQARVKEQSEEIVWLRAERDNLVKENERNHFEKHRLQQLQRDMEQSKETCERLTKENETYIEEVCELRAALDQCSRERSIRYERRRFGPTSLDGDCHVCDESEERPHSLLQSLRKTEAFEQHQKTNPAPTPQQTTDTSTATPSDVRDMAAMMRELERWKMANESAERQVSILQRDKKYQEKNEDILRKRLEELTKDHEMLYEEHLSVKKKFAKLRKEHELCAAVIASLKDLVADTSAKQSLLQLQVEESKKASAKQGPSQTAQAPFRPSVHQLNNTELKEQMEKKHTSWTKS